MYAIANDDGAFWTGEGTETSDLLHEAARWTSLKSASRALITLALDENARDVWFLTYWRPVKQRAK